MTRIFSIPHATRIEHSTNLFFEKSSVMENPYSSPKPNLDDNHVMIARRCRGGIGRLTFIGMMIGLNILEYVLLVGMAPYGLTIRICLILLFFMMSLIPVFFRLKNIGMNPWLCLMIFIPVVNLLVALRCIAFPEGYSDTKQLDGAGKIIMGILIGMLALAFMAFFGLIVYFMINRPP